MRGALKTTEHNELSNHIEQFLQSGGQIDKVPPNVYKREEITMRDKRAILEKSAANIPGAQKLGRKRRELDEIAYKARMMKIGEKK
jgi:hypothetical protein